MLLMAILSAMLVAGLALILVGGRGRRIDHHPVCRNCRFDLSGSPSLVGTCPECGAVINGHASVTIGNRRHSPVAVLAGSLMMVLALAGGWSMSASGVAWKPDWLLESEAQTAGFGVVRDTMDELTKRLLNGTLAPDRARRVLDRALAVQADRSENWDEAWGRYIEAAIRTGAAKPEHAMAYAANGYAFNLVVTEREYAYKVWPVTVEVRPTRGASPVLPFLSWKFNSCEATVSGKALPEVAFAAPPVPTPFVAERMFWLDLDAGEHTARVTCDVVGSVVGANLPDTIPLTFDRTLKLTVNSPKISRVRDSSLEPMIRSIFRAENGYNDISKGRVGGTISASGDPPIPLMFSVYVRTNGQELPAGNFEVRPGVDELRNFTALVGDPSLTRVDIVLRHDGLSNWWDSGWTPDQVWHGEVVIPNVPLRKIDSGDPTTAEGFGR